MTPKRKKAQDTILKYVDKVASGGYNKKLYEDLFKSMSDKEFDEFMVKLKNKKTVLCVVVPHDGSVKVDVENNIKIAKELGYEFFQRLWIEDPVTGQKWLTPNKYLVYRLPIKRTSQLQVKGMSVPKDSRKIDLLTGQVTGESKSSNITLPEIQLLSGMGMEHTLIELLKYRGGDLGAKNAYINMLYKQGRADSKTIEQYSTGVESTKTLKNYFLAAHIKPEGLSE